MNFFDYTSLDDTIPHGLTFLEKVAPILLLILLIFLIYKFQDLIKNYKHEKRIRLTIATMMMIGELAYMIWNFTHSLQGDVRFITTLPFHLCSYAIWGLAFVLYTRNKTVYNYVFVFGVVSVLALIFPNVNHGFNSFRYYQLFYSHGLLMLALVYMYKIHGFYPNKLDLIKSFILLQIIIVYSIIGNIILNTDFLFIGPGNKPIDFAWDWPWHMIEYEIVMGIVYYLVYKTFSKIKNVK